MPIVGDEKITSWLSKSIVIDNQDVQSITDPTEYVILCLRPDERALLTICLAMFPDWIDKWLNFGSELDRSDLIARTFHSLGFEMACSEDIQLIIDNLASIALSQTEIRDNIANQTTSLETKIDALATEVEGIKLAVESLDPSLFDQIEKVLNNTSVILGGVSEVIS